MSLPDYLGPTYRLGGREPGPPPSIWRRIGRTLLELVWPLGPIFWSTVFLGAVALLGFLGIVFYARLPARLPADLDWAAAAALLERDALPGDIVALSPPWAERARLVLPASLPVLARPDYREEDLAGVRRVWVLSLPSAPGFSYDIETGLAKRAGSYDGPQRLGGIEVTRYDLNGPVIPLAWLPDRLASAQVSAGGEPCFADAEGAFRCPGAPGVRLSRQVREVDYLPRPCLFVLPPPGGAPLAIEFPSVPMGRALRGHTGIVGEAMLSGSAPVRLEARVDGELVGLAEEPPRTPGWHAFQFDTTRWTGRLFTVTVTVATADAERRPLCVEAMTLP